MFLCDYSMYSTSFFLTQAQKTWCLHFLFLWLYWLSHDSRLLVFLFLLLLCATTVSMIQRAYEFFVELVVNTIANMLFLDKVMFHSDTTYMLEGCL